MRSEFREDKPDASMVMRMTKEQIRSIKLMASWQKMTMGKFLSICTKNGVAEAYMAMRRGLEMDGHNIAQVNDVLEERIRQRDEQK